MRQQVTTEDFDDVQFTTLENSHRHLDQWPKAYKAILFTRKTQVISG